MNTWTGFQIGLALGSMFGVALMSAFIFLPPWLERRQRERDEDVQRVNEGRRHA